MSRARVRNQDEKTTAPVYLLTGESFLVDEALDRIRIDAGLDPLSEESFAAGDDVEEMLSSIETPSLLGGRRLVVIHDVDALKKAALERVEAYVQGPALHTVLVLVASGRTKLAPAVKKYGGEIVALEAPKGRKLAAWVRERAMTKRLKMDDRAAWTLMDAIGTDLRELDASLEQLSTLLGRDATVSVRDVHKVFPRHADERIYAFTDAVGERRLPSAMTTLRRLFEQGDEPLVVLGALTAHVRRLLVAHSLAEQGTATLAGALGMPEWRAEKLYRQVRSFKEEDLAHAVEVLAAADVDMKGGDLPPQLALERAVVRIVTGT